MRHVDGAKALIDAGADAVKVGFGPGSTGTKHARGGRGRHAATDRKSWTAVEVAAASRGARR